LNVNEASFANVPPMQMRVMKYGKAAPGLAATANISAFKYRKRARRIDWRRRRLQFIRNERHPFIAAAIEPAVALLLIPS